MAVATTATIAEAVDAARRALALRSDVVAIRDGYRFKAGWITDERCVVVYVRRKLTPEQLAASGMTAMPDQFLGVPVDIAVAALSEPGSFALIQHAQAAASAPVSNYRKRPDLPLNLVEDDMEVIAHASPDAGWPTLRSFLGRIETRLTVGMYEYTAPHILEAMQAAFSSNTKALSLVLQNRNEARKPGSPTEHDLLEQQTVDALEHDLAHRFDFAWASVKGRNRLFDTSYHIKVAVRDAAEFWLSSGSWRSSNQAPFDPIADGDQTPPLLDRYDRDWHVVVAHQGLATLLEKHLLRDRLEAAAVQAATFAAAISAEPEVWVPQMVAAAALAAAPPIYRPPLRVNRTVKVQPLLTPDNYAEHVIGYISDAKHSVLFQNQSLAPKNPNGADFEKLLQALLAKQKDPNIDTRIIIRSGFAGDRELLSALKDFGFDTSRERVHLQDGLHAKGIVIDNESVLVGSHNWTTSGTAFNRDASLIFFDPEIAKYFSKLFEYDWSRKPVGVNESLVAAEFVQPGDPPTRPGMMRMPLSEWAGD
jgi:hypothetical protein